MIAFGDSDSDILKGSSYQQQLHLSSFIRDVDYSCGSCGYELNLSSSNRNTTSFADSSKYGKSIKRGVVSFFSVDESRFTQIHHLRWSSLSWIPFFTSKKSQRGFVFQPRRWTKLLCRRCGTHLGSAYYLPASEKNSWDGISDDSRIYDIKLSALQPSFSEDPIPMSGGMAKLESASSSSVVF